MYIHTYTHTYIRTCTHPHTHTHNYLSVCESADLSTFLSLYLSRSGQQAAVLNDSAKTTTRTLMCTTLVHNYI